MSRGSVARLARALQRVAVAVACLAACAKSGPDLSAHAGDQDSGGFTVDGTLPGEDAGPIDLEAGPPYAVLGISPSHGPFAGGTRIEIRGRGFSSHTHVK